VVEDHDGVGPDFVCALGLPHNDVAVAGVGGGVEVVAPGTPSV
jgi:hypothetical protein